MNSEFIHELMVNTTSSWLIELLHQSIIYDHLSLSEGLEPMGERRGTSWTRHHFITGLIHRNKQWFTLTSHLQLAAWFTPACLWTVGGSWSTQKDPTQTRATENPEPSWGDCYNKLQFTLTLTEVSFPFVLWWNVFHSWRNDWCHLFSSSWFDSPHSPWFIIHLP